MLCFTVTMNWFSMYANGDSHTLIFKVSVFVTLTIHRELHKYHYWMELEIWKYNVKLFMTVKWYIPPCIVHNYKMHLLPVYSHIRHCNAAWCAKKLLLLSMYFALQWSRFHNAKINVVLPLILYMLCWEKTLTLSTPKYT